MSYYIYGFWKHWVKIKSHVKKSNYRVYYVNFKTQQYTFCMHTHTHTFAIHQIRDGGCLWGGGMRLEHGGKHKRLKCICNVLLILIILKVSITQCLLLSNLGGR